MIIRVFENRIVGSDYATIEGSLSGRKGFNDEGVTIINESDFRSENPKVGRTEIFKLKVSNDFETSNPPYRDVANGIYEQKSVIEEQGYEITIIQEFDNFRSYHPYTSMTIKKKVV